MSDINTIASSLN